MKEKVETGLPDSSAPSEWAIKADNILYTVHWACLPDGNCSTGDIREQTRITLENLKRTVEAAGGTMADIVKLNYYLVAEVDQANVPKLRPIRDRYLNVENPPASTFVVVSRLMRPGWLIEIEAIAALDA